MLKRLCAGLCTVWSDCRITAYLGNLLRLWDTKHYCVWSVSAEAPWRCFLFFPLFWAWCVGQGCNPNILMLVYLNQTVLKWERASDMESSVYWLLRSVNWKKTHATLTCMWFISASSWPWKVWNIHAERHRPLPWFTGKNSSSDCLNCILQTPRVLVIL